MKWKLMKMPEVVPEVEPLVEWTGRTHQEMQIGGIWKPCSGIKRMPRRRGVLGG